HYDWFKEWGQVSSTRVVFLRQQIRYLPTGNVEVLLSSGRRGTDRRLRRIASRRSKAAGVPGYASSNLTMALHNTQDGSNKWKIELTESSRGASGGRSWRPRL